MGRQMFLYEMSSNPVTEVAESVPDTVQTASSGGLRLIGFVLVIMMCILAILTVTLIMIEMRQDTLRTVIHTMVRRLERMERQLNIRGMGTNDETNDLEVELERKGKERDKVREKEITDSGDTGTAGKMLGSDDVKDKSQQTKDTVFSTEANSPSRQENAQGSKLAVNFSTGLTGGNNRYQEPAVRKEPCQIMGLRIKDSSHYNPQKDIQFEEIDPSDALLILYSDMTIQLPDRLFGGYNKFSYYANNDITMVYDFVDNERYLLDGKHPFKCWKTYELARVKNTQNGYILDKKGIIIAEEKLT